MAYKTVELDDLLGGSRVQHREVEGRESGEFEVLFPEGIAVSCQQMVLLARYSQCEYPDPPRSHVSYQYFEGGIDSRFRHVEVGEDDLAADTSASTAYPSGRGAGPRA